jgi:hypothetical protein
MIRRRKFIAGIGSAAAWPGVARAQHASSTTKRLTCSAAMLAHGGVAGATRPLDTVLRDDGRKLSPPA